jgi:hypothetical protein
MPCDYSKYPANWKTEIVPRILNRAGERRDDDGNIVQEALCEVCRKAVNHWYRTRVGGHETYVKTRLLAADVQIVLTTMHVDHNLEKNGDDDLKAACQRCHLKHDAKQHAENARRTREKSTGQLRLLDD